MLKTFSKGGVHPPEQKLTAHRPIEALPIPDSVILPLAQHLGLPAIPVVSRDELVKAGQLIARGQGPVSANLHAPVSGKVTALDDFPDASGYRRPAIAIQTQGDEWVDGVDLSPGIIRDFDLSPEEIIARITQAGIVGMGGATFPTHIKLSVPVGKKTDVLIINGVECEPYLTADHRLMLERGEELLTGIRLMMKALKVKRAVIGIENNKRDAIIHLQSLIRNERDLEVVALVVRYPQGGEKQLIRAVLGREVPSGHLPVDVGAVVHNVGTVLAVYEAVMKNKPLVERVVTVTGKGLFNPSNFLVRLGTPVSALIEAAGGMPEGTGKVVNGGPMMGKALHRTDVPVTKGTSGILVIPESEARRNTLQVCVRCSKCIGVCPMGLEPYLLSAMVEKSRFADTEREHIMDCMECGCCSYTCPSARPLLDYIRLGKSKVGQLIRQRKMQ